MKYFLLFWCFCSISLAAQTEKQYSDFFQMKLGGEREVSVDGGRIDLLTESTAYEVERAPKWKDAIGQCLWYAIQTNRKPGIILILEKKSDYKYVVMLHSTIEYANLDVEVKVYPIDF